MRCEPCHQSQNHTRENLSNTGQVKSGILQEAYVMHAWAANSQGHTLPTLQN